MDERNDFRDVARLLKTLGHPVRLKIVCGLLHEPATLSRIARELKVPLSTLAQHLAVLRGAQVLREEKHGVEVIFSVADRRVPAVLRSLCTSTVRRGKRS